MNLEDIQHHIDNVFDSPESDIFFHNMLKKYKLKKIRFKKLDRINHNFDQILQKILDKFNNKHKTIPNNLLKFIFDYVGFKNDYQSTINYEISLIDFPNIVYDFDKYYFQTIFGQGTILRIYEHHPKLKLIFQN